MRSSPLLLLLAAYLALGLLYSAATPPFEASDEVFHYPFVRHVALGRGLPVQRLDDHELWEQVGFHPPAYYYLAAALTFWIDTSDFDSLRDPNPFARIGIPGAPQNINYTRAAARAVVEPFVLRGSALAIYLIRLLSLFLGACTVTLAYLFASTFSHSPAEGESRRASGLPLLAAGLVAFNPTFVFISASVNNDGLTWLIAVASLFIAVHLVRGPSHLIKREIGDGRLDVLGMGVLLGIGALTKVSVLILTPVIGLALLAQAVRTRRWARFFINGAIVVGLVALISGWWYVRNVTLYDELLALKIHSLYTATRLEPYTLNTFFSEWPSFWLSFWSMFGSFNILASGWVYTFFSALTLGGIAGGVWGLIRNRSNFRNTSRWLLVTHGLLVVFIAVTAISLLRWNLLSYSAQGRLMFTTLAPIMMYLAAGLLSWIPRRWMLKFVGALAGVLGFVALHVAVIDVAAAYIPPPPLAEFDLPPDLKPVQAVLAPGVELIGYTVQSPERLVPGGLLTVTFYWRALDLISTDCNLFLHVLGRNRALVGNIDTWPGGGLRPTSFWQPGDIYSDRYVIQIDSKSITPSSLWLDIGMWGENPAQPFPITTLSGESIPSILVGVGLLDSPQPIAARPAHTNNSTLEGGITLLGYDLPSILAASQPADLTLYWQTTTSAPIDYTVFIHVIDSTGSTVAQADGPPANGDWPTSHWQAGFPVADTHSITIPSSGDYKILVGLYDPATVIPLPAYRPDGTEWPDRAIELATVTVK
jgi:4-amino-4-deoxy-L-arabinose transferase-like glycosyltransferase